MPQYRSRTSTAGRNMAGARALWRATGMKDGDFEKPIIAIANSFTQFVPGHVHLKDLGQLVAREIEAAGGVAKEKASLHPHICGPKTTGKISSRKYCKFPLGSMKFRGRFTINPIVALNISYWKFQ